MKTFPYFKYIQHKNNLKFQTEILMNSRLDLGSNFLSFLQVSWASFEIKSTSQCVLSPRPQISGIFSAEQCEHIASVCQQLCVVIYTYLHWEPYRSSDRGIGPETPKDDKNYHLIGLPATRRLALVMRRVKSQPRPKL